MKTTYQDWRFLDPIVVRGPIRPLTEFCTTELELHSFVNAAWFQNAVYLSSPSFLLRTLESLEQKNVDPRKMGELNSTLYKYQSRSTFRSVPFGLFSFFGVGIWSELSRVNVDQRNMFLTSTLDPNFEAVLLSKFEREMGLLENIWQANPTIYLVNGNYRYYRMKEISHISSFLLSEVRLNSTLQKVVEFCLSPRRESSIVELIVKIGYSSEEAKSFFRDLGTNGLLIRKDCLRLMPKSDEFHKEIDQHSAYEEFIFRRLGRASKMLSTINIQKVDITVLQDSLKLNEEYEVSRSVFNVNTELRSDEIELHSSFQKPLIDALNWFRANIQQIALPRLEKFKARFIDRFDGEMIPIMWALDSDIGLDYHNIKINQERNNDSSTFNEETLLAQNLASLILKNEIDEIDVSSFGKTLGSISHDLLPKVLPAVFEVVDINGQETLKLSYFGSGANSCALIARFHSSSDKVDVACRLIAEREIECNENVLFAEIIHVPNSDLEFILSRPPLYKYAICFFGNCPAGVENIALDDLFLFNFNGDLILWSKKHRKRIIPRLTSAHNYNREQLPIYKFLCDFQFNNEHSSALLFVWPRVFDKMQRLPRVVHRNVILAPATWRLFEGDLQYLKKIRKCDNLKEQLDLWVKKMNLPQRIVVRNADMNLLFDVSDDIGCRAFLDTIRTKDIIELEEFLPPSRISSNEACGSFNTQYVAFIDNIKKKPYQLPPDAESVADLSVSRLFLAGDDWVYYKIYCNENYANKILLIVNDVIAKFKPSSKNNFVQWFFVRYGDPLFHLRIRIMITEVISFEKINRLLIENLKGLLAGKLIHNLELGTYVREIERYGIRNIEIVEKLFCADSQLYLATSFLEENSNRNRITIQIIYFDLMLTDVGISLSEKLDLFKNLFVDFEKEYMHGKKSHSLIDSLPENFDKLVKDYLEEREGSPLIYACKTTYLGSMRRSDFKSCGSWILSNEGTNPINVLRSIFHMSVNRRFPTDQLYYEYLVYYAAFRMYKSYFSRITK